MLVVAEPGSSNVYVVAEYRRAGLGGEQAGVHVQSKLAKMVLLLNKKHLDVLKQHRVVDQEALSGGFKRAA